MIFGYRYIKEEGLLNLSDYKYASNDRSIFANYVMQPFWNTAVRWLPEWLAPNAITWIGFSAILLSFFLTAYYSPTLSSSLPPWLYFLNAFCLFFYQTLDALDGKQARLTRTSSPLGELFDHGCDAMATVMTALVGGAALKAGPGPLMYSNVIVLLVTFFLTQWDVYFNGILDLWYINVTEAQIFGMCLQLAPFFFGPDFWTQQLTIGTLTMTYAKWALIPSTLTCFMFCVSSIQNVIHHCKYHPDKERWKRSVLSAIPCLIITFSYTWWFFNSPHLMKRYPYIFCTCVGFLYANLVGKCVTARVCKLSCDLLHYNLILLPVVVINSYGKWISEEHLLFAYCAVAVLSYMDFGVCIIIQMTTHLGIKTFTIPYKPHLIQIEKLEPDKSTTTTTTTTTLSSSRIAKPKSTKFNISSSEIGKLE